MALAITLGMFAIELAGFFSGVSMFNCSQGLLCILYTCTVGLLMMMIDMCTCKQKLISIKSGAINTNNLLSNDIPLSVLVAKWSQHTTAISLV